MIEQCFVLKRQSLITIEVAPTVYTSLFIPSNHTLKLNKDTLLQRTYELLWSETKIYRNKHYIVHELFIRYYKLIRIY